MQAPESRRRPTPVGAIFLFAAVLLTNIGLGIAVTRTGLDEMWMLVATPLLVLFWTGLAAWLFRVDLKKTFLLRLPARSDLLMAVPLAISFVVLNDQLSSFADAMIPDEVRIGWLRMVRISGPIEWIFKVSTIGVGAAISEELMFRGFIQTAFGSSMSRSAAVIWTSFLFMALHVLPLPSFAAAGLVLGFTAVATGSIVIPILIHFINNAAALLLVNLTDLETLGDPVWIPAPILVPATLIFILTMGFFARRLATEPSKPGAQEFGGAGDGENGRAFGRDEDSRGGLRAPPLSDELASIPAGKRRLGWVVVAVSLLVGVSVLLGLSASSLYLSRPQAVHAAFLEALSQTCRERLTPEAYDRTPEIEIAFESLAAINNAGGLSLTYLLRVLSVTATVSADGSVDTDEVDTLLDAMHEVIQSASTPRRL